MNKTAGPVSWRWWSQECQVILQLGDPLPAAQFLCLAPPLLTCGLRRLTETLFWVSHWFPAAVLTTKFGSPITPILQFIPAVSVLAVLATGNISGFYHDFFLINIETLGVKWHTRTCLPMTGLRLSRLRVFALQTPSLTLQHFYSSIQVQRRMNTRGSLARQCSSVSKLLAQWTILPYENQYKTE